MTSQLDNNYTICLQEEYHKIKYLISSKDFIDQLTNDISRYYSKLGIGNNDSEISCNNLMELNKSLGDLISDRKRIKNYSILENAINYQYKCIEHIKNILPEQCIVGVINDIDDSYKKLTKKIETFLKNLSEGNNEIREKIYSTFDAQEILQYINQINNSLNLIINYYNYQKSIQNKFLKFVNSIKSFMNKFIQNEGNFLLKSKEKNVDLHYCTFYSCYIDQNQKLVFDFIPAPKKNEEVFKEVKRFSLDCIKQFFKKIKFDSFIFKYYERRFKQNYDETKQYIDEYFKQEISDFSNNLHQEFNATFSEENHKKILDFQISDNFPIIDFKDYNSESSWGILNEVTKLNFPINKKWLYHNYKFLLRDYTTTNEEQQINEVNVCLTKEQIKGMMFKLTEEYRNKGKYFFFNILSSKTIQTIFNQSNFEKKIHSKKEKYSLYTIFYSYKDFAFNDCYITHDQNFQFWQEKTTSEREKKILTKNYSKFIVQGKLSHRTDPNDKETIIIPYFPLGNLNSIHNDGEIQFSHVDKIIIMLEIATALKDLHSENEYHGNLSSDFIVINSSKDAYLGAIKYDLDESNLSQPINTIYYHPPEYYQKDEEKVYNESCDVYAFGLIMYEIVSEKPLIQKYQKIKKYERVKIMENGESNKFLLVDDIVKKIDSYDEKGDSLIGVKEIIEKCIRKDINNRYQSFDEIIESIKSLAIYSKNKEEIDYRFENAQDSSEYKCSMSDIVECYIHGSSQSKIIIERVIKKYFDIEDLNCDNIIQKLIELFHIENKTDFILEKMIKLMIEYDEKCIIKSQGDDKKTDSFWNLLLNRYKYHIPTDVNSQFWCLPIKNGAFNASNETKNLFLFINELFNKYRMYIGDRPKEDAYHEFMILNDINDNSGNNKKGQKLAIEDKINAYEKMYSHFYIDQIIQITMRNILKPKFFSDQFHETLRHVQNYSELHYIKDTLNFNEIDSSFKLFYDNNFNFVLQKTYNQNINKLIRDREINILKENYSKFIVHIEEESQENKITIPYFPCGTLDSIIRKQPQNSISLQNKTLEFNLIDKIVIALEVAIALKDLHSHNEYHGNLASQFIYINANKDAYIGGIAYDRKLEADSTKPRGPFYYRAPEIIYYNYYFSSDENTRNQQMYDIYSYGVLLHEIITEISPEKRMGNKPREERLKLLKKEYNKFLFDDIDNEFFGEGSYDTRGDTLIEKGKQNGVEKIINKCMDGDPRNRYKSFDEIINDFKETKFYKKNQFDIENRIENAKYSADYQCSFCDIVEAYYRGNESSLNDIEKTIMEYEKLYSQKNELFHHVEGDIIETLFNTFDIKLGLIQKSSDDINNKLNSIVKNHVNETLDRSEIISYQNSLLNISLIKNNECSSNLEKNRNIHVPITSLAKYNQNKKKIDPTWVYIIASEMSYIHSRNIFYGDFSAESIGIYYDSTKKMLVPSIILYYAYKKSSSKDKIEAQYDYSIKSIEKYLRKDLKAFKKMILELNGEDDEVYQNIKESLSFNEIVYMIYNLIMRDRNPKEKKYISDKIKIDYTSFQITYQSLQKIYEIFNLEYYIYNDFYFKFDKILDEIICFLNEKIDNSSLLKGEAIGNVDKCFVQNEFSDNIRNKFEEIEFLKGLYKCKMQ